MIYDHIVNLNGTYYKAGENVPDEETVEKASVDKADAKPAVRKTRTTKK